MNKKSTYRMIEVWGTRGPGTYSMGKFKVSAGSTRDMTRQAVAKAKNRYGKYEWTYYCPKSQFNARVAQG